MIKKKITSKIDLDKKDKEDSMRIPWEEIEVKDGIPMNGEEIAKDIYKQTGVKVTRQNISNALKSAMKSFFLKLQEEEPNLSPFEVASLMVQMLYMPYHNNDKEFRKSINSFFRLFPKDIKRIIEDDAKRYQNIYKSNILHEM